MNPDVIRLMPSQIYNEIVGHSFRSFLDRYRSTRKWFKDELAANHLFHAGEFGASREAAVRDLLSKFVGTRFNSGHGFIINSRDIHSSQCDIVIYDCSNTPLRDEESGFRFHLADSVVGIGEVKSVLDKATLKHAMVKLAKSKSVCNKAPLSFLVCERIEGFDAEIGQLLDTAYTDAEIANRHRHTFILSIENGVCAYEFNQPNTLLFTYPNHRDWFHSRTNPYSRAFTPKIFESKDAHKNVARFAHLIFKAVSMTPDLSIDLGPYLNEG